MNQAAINRVLRCYDCDPGKLLAVEKGYRNETHPIRLGDGRQLNLIVYKSELDIVRTIRNANQTSDFLAECGFPTRRTADPRILRLRSGCQERFAALYNYLSGQTIPWEAYTQKHIKLLGKTMSDMHAALRDFDASGLPDVPDVYLEIVVRMQRYFAETGVRRALAEKLRLAPPKFDACVATLQACKHLPGQQALHMDFVRSNILFGDAFGELVITGILDFEKTARGNALFDIARTLAFLLVDCKYKPPEKVRKYFLTSGYQKRGAADFQNVSIKTKAGNIDVLESLISVFLLHDFYKFLRHNPYDSLPQNTHFIRTRDLLLHHGLVVR
ncbi:MAG TPA: phosphotransferase [Candidatus Saccharimonadales bacterium]|jgi:Ser/Thr protein kinase RdoA (MazF antagonist)